MSNICRANPRTADVRCRTARDYRGAQAAPVKSKTLRSQRTSEASPNKLIAALPRRSQDTVLASCDRVDLRFAAVLCDQGECLQRVYFPLDSVISLVTTLADGPRLEVGIIGNEGMLGTSVLLGVNVSPQRAVVQGGGSALSMGAAVFRRHCERDSDLREVMNRYVHVLLEQLSQTAACAAFHPVESRLARWLLHAWSTARGRDSRCALFAGAGTDRLSPGSDHDPRSVRFAEGFVCLLRSRQPHLSADAGLRSPPPLVKTLAWLYTIVQ